MASFPTRRTRNYPEGVGVGVESGERGGASASTKYFRKYQASTKYFYKYQASTKYLWKYQASTKYFGKYRVLMQIPSKYQVLWQVPSTLASTKQVPSTFASSASFSPISKLLDVRSSPEKHHSIPNFLPNLFMAKATRSEPRYLV